MLSILAWLVVGGVAGYLASIIMKTNATQGMMMDVILGVVGAIVGGFLLGLFGIEGTTGFSLWSLFVATLGAVTLIALGRALNRV